MTQTTATLARQRQLHHPYTQTQLLLLLFQILCTCSLSLLTQFTLNENTAVDDTSNSSFAYNSLSVPFFAEFMKLSLSIALFLRQRRTNTSSSSSMSTSDNDRLDYGQKTVLLAAVPATLYAVSNNLNFFVIADIGAFSYQMLNQLKIVCTAVAFRVIMNKKLSKLQWRMMVLLTIGCMVSQMNGSSGAGAADVHRADNVNMFAGNHGQQRKGRVLLMNDNSNNNVGRITQGYFLESFAVVTSSLAGVLVEMFLKKTTNPFYFQNCLLYGWGTAITFVSLVFDTKFFEGGGFFLVLFRGHTVASFVLILNSAFGGLATAAVMKYLDVIAKTFATTVSLFIVAFVSIAYLGESMRAELFLGTIVAAIAIEGYYHGPSLVDDDSNTNNNKFEDDEGEEKKNSLSSELRDFSLGDDDNDVNDDFHLREAINNIKNAKMKDAIV